MYELTPGQAERMLTAFDYRVNFQANPAIQIQSMIRSEPVDLMASQVQLYKLETDGPSEVVCLVSSEEAEEEGDNLPSFDIFMRFDEMAVPALDLYDCYTRLGLCHVSTTRSDPATVWVHVSPQEDHTGVNVICYDLEPNPTTLISYGVPTNISQANENLFFELELPTVESWITCRLAAIEGDADIAIRFDHLPSQFAYSDAASVSDLTANEMFWVQVPHDATRAYVVVRVEDTLGTANFTCYISEGTSSALEDEVASDPISLEANGIKIFSLDVEVGSIGVECSATTKSGDGWFALEWGDKPRHRFSACTSDTIKEPCILSIPGDENRYDFVPIVYALVRAADTMEDLSVTCKALLPNIQSLEPLNGSVSVDLLARESAFYVIDTVQDETITCSTSESVGSEGDVDLYLSFDNPVFPYNARTANCSSESSDSVEICSLTVPENTTQVHLLLRPFGGAVSSVKAACTTDGSVPQSEVQDRTERPAPSNASCEYEKILVILGLAYSLCLLLLWE